MSIIAHYLTAKFHSISSVLTSIQQQHIERVLRWFDFIDDDDATCSINETSRHKQNMHQSCD